MPLSHAAQHSLPAQFTSFIGREDEINALAALLVGPACRLVSLVGPGGVGKTRVAITLAERLAAQSRPDLPRRSPTCCAARRPAQPIRTSTCSRTSSPGTCCWCWIPSSIYARMPRC